MKKPVLEARPAQKQLGCSLMKRLSTPTASPYEVRVFPMIVKRQLDPWPEANERGARWFEPANAFSAIKDKGLWQLIDSFVRRMSAKTPHA